MAVDAGASEQAAPEANFEKGGVGRDSTRRLRTRQLRDKRPGEVAERLMR